MSYHQLVDGATYGVIVHNGTLTEGGTRNVDLTTLSDDSTASGIPSEICCVHMLMTTDDGGVYEVNDNDETLDPYSAAYGGPNVWGHEADADYFVAGITKTDGSIDVVVPSLGSDPTVKITVLGYSDVDWHDVQQFDTSYSWDCSTRHYSVTMSSRSIVDAASANVGAGWHKAKIDVNPGEVTGCAVAGGANDYYLVDVRFAIADLAAYEPAHTEDINSSDALNRGSGYVMQMVDGALSDILSFTTDADGEIAHRMYGDEDTVFNPA